MWMVTGMGYHITVERTRLACPRRKSCGTADGWHSEFRSLDPGSTLAISSDEGPSMYPWVAVASVHPLLVQWASKVVIS